MTLKDPSDVFFGLDESPPGPSAVLVLNYHHDGESHWCSPGQAIARIEFILDGGKAEEERGARMEAMKIVLYGRWWTSRARYKAAAVYEKARSEARAVNEKARSEAWAVYRKALSDLWGDEYPAEAWAAEQKEAEP